ncbi:hypothetical protein BJ878DRAFT_158421 [Calycina marina]|uniref:Uncharacterized protein n=1 Tax=Calycina marina TaxID=1763456 RepID=A0A9P7Z0J1_9HELO|nr:hypothetical protein BJ878DRAFT_158421 [Calycina marina]
MDTMTRNTIRIFQMYLELAHSVPTIVSDYRLFFEEEGEKETYDAGKSLCRILIFLNPFRKVNFESPRKTIQQLRDNAFHRHGARRRSLSGGSHQAKAYIKLPTSETSSSPWKFQ